MSIFFIIIFVTISSLVMGQSIPNMDKQRGIDEQDRLLMREQSRLNAYQTRLDLAKPFQPTSQSITAKIPSSQATAVSDQFLIKTIVLQGISPLFKQELYALVKPYQDRWLSKMDIRNVVQDITQYYFTRGFIAARVYLPDQSLKGGILTLHVLEGRIDRIVFDKATDAQKWTAFPGLEGQLLNLKDLEEGLDQLHRLNAWRATFRLEPNPEKWGYANVVIDATIRNGNALGLRYDTYNQDHLQIYPTELWISQENILQANDLWQIRYAQMHQGQEQFSNTLSIQESMPIGGFLSNIAYSQFDYNTLIKGLGRNFMSSGQTRSYTYSVQHTLHRDAHSKLLLCWGLALKHTDAFIEDVRQDTSSRKLSVVSIGPIWTYHDADYFLRLNVAYQTGLGAFGASQDDPQRAADVPKAQFKKYTLQATGVLYQLFGTPLSFTHQFNAQYSGETLYSNEQMGIGDYYTVRGFWGTYLQGDQGLLYKADIQYPLDPQWSLYYGFDTGTIYKVSDKSADSLTGQAFGVRYQVNQWVWDMSYATPINRAKSQELPQGKWFLGVTISLL